MSDLRLRPPGADDLGVRRALSDRLLPGLVAAMAFLAALACAGAQGAATLAAHWQQGAASTLTIQVPQPAEPAPTGGTRLARVRAVLAAAPAIHAVRLLGDDELQALLRPWLGAGASHLDIPLPAVLELHTEADGPARAALDSALEAAAPGTLIEENDRWAGRIGLLARSLQACATVALAVVAFVAVAVVAVATRAGLAARRDAIETVHGLGSTDGYIARRFAQRASTLATVGAAAGAGAALPVLIALSVLAAPFSFQAADDTPAAMLAMPVTLWLALPLLPILAGAIGWFTAQRTVRSWLRRLP